MAAQNLEPDRLTPADKYKTIKARALVEVKTLARAGMPPLWQRARIKETKRDGAFCRTDRGKDGFYYWSDIRPCEVDPPAPKPLATLGEIARGGLRALPPFLDTEPPKPSPPPPPALADPSPMEAKAVLLISNEDLNDMASKPKRLKHATIITPIAALFRAERLKRSWSQAEVAESLSSKTLRVSNGQISSIENGRIAPTDDILIAFSSLFALDLVDLINTRDGKPEPAKRVPPVTVIPAPAVVVPPPAPVVAVPVSAAPEPPDMAERVAAFTDHLMGLAPPPLDREKRVEWFRLAAKLFRLSEA